MALMNEESFPLNIPPKLPIILKQFCKAAIKTQPYDLLKWSSAYFHALAEGEEPPTKIRLEYPLPASVSGLTLGFLKILLRQFGDYNKILSVETYLRRWDDLCLERQHLNLIMIIGKFRRKCQVKKFLAIAVGLLGSSLFDTMLMICELFTMEPDGGSAMIPASLFMELYEYLAELGCDGQPRETKEDLSEFVILDSLEPGTPELSEEFNKFSSPRGSVTSGCTDVVNLESVDLSNKESASNGKALSEDRTDVKILDNEKAMIYLQDLVSSARDDNSSTLSRSDSDRKSSGRRSGREKRELIRAKKKMIDSTWTTHYPNVPGIGPQLSPAEISAVREWMAGCAKVQEGMIGPRNLRHFQCPPLDRLKSP